MMRVLEMVKVVIDTLNCKGCRRHIPRDGACFQERDSGDYYCPECVNLGTLTLKSDAKPDKPPPAEPKLDDGGPAYPMTHRQPDGTTFTIPGMSLRTRSAIDLEVPESEVPFVNTMIQQSRRNELAATASDGEVDIFTAQNPNGSVAEETVEARYRYADAMLAQADKRVESSKAELQPKEPDDGEG